MNHSNAATTTNVAIEEYSILDSIVERSRIARNEEEHDRAKSLIGELARKSWPVPL